MPRGEPVNLFPVPLPRSRYTAAIVRPRGRDQSGGTQEPQRQCRLILSGEVIDGQAALALGLVQWAAPRDDLGAAATALTDRIVALSAGSLREAKRLIAAAADPARNGFAEELEADRRLFDDPDTRQRVARFLARGR